MIHVGWTRISTEGWGHIAMTNHAQIQPRGFAIVRVDLFHGEEVTWENRITVKRIVWSEAIADAEVARLNELNGEKGCVYFWQSVRVAESPPLPEAEINQPSVAAPATREVDSLSSVASNIRGRVLEVLELIANQQAQFEYQAIATGVHVAHEIFNQWEDYYRPETVEFAAAFTRRELELLREFHGVFEEVAEGTPQILPTIHDFARTEEWRKYSEAARRTLQDLD